MTRLPGWEYILDSFLRANEHRKFQYGSWDCCLFVADAIFVMTMVDVAEEFRGKYANRRTAMLQAAGKCGRKSVGKLAEKVFESHNMTSVLNPLAARRGDVALMQRGRSYSLGIVGLNGLDVIIVSDLGLWRLPLASAARAWRVG